MASAVPPAPVTGGPSSWLMLKPPWLRLRISWGADVRSGALIAGSGTGSVVAAVVVVVSAVYGLQRAGRTGAIREGALGRFSRVANRAAMSVVLRLASAVRGGDSAADVVYPPGDGT